MSQAWRTTLKQNIERAKAKLPPDFPVLSTRGLMGAEIGGGSEARVTGADTDATITFAAVAVSFNVDTRTNNPTATLRERMTELPRNRSLLA